MMHRSRPGQADGAMLLAPAGLQRDDADQPILRIRRVGRRLFGVADCIVIPVEAGAPEPGTTPPSMPIEVRFCYDVLSSPGRIAVPDVGDERTLSSHPAVVGAPYIRFFASHSIFSQDNERIGTICLIDTVPRTAFGDEERQLLGDLAALVERELAFRLVNASQLDLQKKNKNLRRKSLIDPLIGTWNRGAIMRILTIEAIRCDKAGEPLSLIVVDLDYFKKINDSYGHPAGDAVLVKVASRMRSCIRPKEALGRYGGEEFLIVLPGSSHTTAMSVAERMRLAIASQPELIGGVTLNLTISAGVASTDLFPHASTEELISRADVALYAAKDAGRNCVTLAAPELS